LDNRHNRRTREALTSRAKRSGHPLELQRPAPAGFDPTTLPGFDLFKLLDAKEAAAEVRLSLPAFWRQVRQERLPKPLYPAPRCPRWVLSELRAALLATRCLPTDAMAARRQARLTSITTSSEGKE
jgi:predicted DNA-binding transcriptional regulator AlpA